MIHQPELRPTSHPLPGDHGECDWGAEMPDRQLDLLSLSLLFLSPLSFSFSPSPFLSLSLSLSFSLSIFSLRFLSHSLFFSFCDL